MKAVACENSQLGVVDRPAPEPEKGQVLLQVLRCGICGSDLHARHHCDELAEVLSEVGYGDFMRSNQSVVFDEFCGEVAAYGQGCNKRIPTGSHVVALPLVRRGGKPQAIGLSGRRRGPTPSRLWSRNP